MAYSPFTSAQVAVGEATKTELFVKMKDNDDDHETRILSLEGGATSTFPLGFFIMNSASVLDDAAKERVPFDITITSVILKVDEAGTAGSLEVDVLSDQGGSFSTVLSGGNLVVAFGAGDGAEVTSSGIAIADNDLGKRFRLDVKAVQTGMRNAEVKINYTVR